MRTNEQQVRRWLQLFAEKAPESAAFSVGRTIELLYGRPADGAFESDRGLVEYLLAFANGDADRSEMQQYLDGDSVLNNAAGWAKNPAYLLLAMESGKRQVRSVAAVRLLDAKIVADRRAWLRELLAATRSNKAQAAERYLASVIQQLERMWSVPRVRPGDCDLQHLVVIENSASLCAYVALLLLGPLGSELCQCTLEGCTRYFLVKKPKTGRPQRLYCTREHMLEAHGKNATQRSAHSRANKAARKPK
jgi:hypothetical protein